MEICEKDFLEPHKSQFKQKSDTKVPIQLLYKIKILLGFSGDVYITKSTFKYMFGSCLWKLYEYLPIKYVYISHVIRMFSTFPHERREKPSIN